MKPKPSHCFVATSRISFHKNSTTDQSQLMSHPVKRGKMASLPPPPPKKIRSQPPDVVVAVGSGDTLKEFECYKVVLSFASEYFDAMLSANMVENETSRIEFPNKDPAEWELLYRFIDPGQMRGAELESDVAITLLPWFHEFQMENFLQECDKVIAAKCEDLSRREHCTTSDFECFWAENLSQGINVKKSMFKRIISYLQLACTYDLEETEKAAGGFLESLNNNREKLQHTHELFDINTIKALVPLILPLELKDGSYESHGKSKSAFSFFRSFEWEHGASLSPDLINNNEIFPYLLHSYLHHSAYKCKADAEVSEAKSEASEMKVASRKIINSWIKDSPNDLCNTLPHKKSMNEYIDTSASDCLRKVIYEQFKNKNSKEFEKLELSVPEHYARNRALETAVLRYIRSEGEGANGVDMYSILAFLGRNHWSEEDVREAISNLLSEGEIYNVDDPGSFKARRGGLRID